MAKIFKTTKKTTPPVVVTVTLGFVSHYVAKPDGDIVLRFLAPSSGVAHDFNIFIDSLDAKTATFKATVFSGVVETAVYFDVKEGANQPNIDVPIDVNAGDRLILKIEKISKNKSEQTGEIKGILLSFIFEM